MLAASEIPSEPAGVEARSIPLAWGTKQKSGDAFCMCCRQRFSSECHDVELVGKVCRECPRQELPEAALGNGLKAEAMGGQASSARRNYFWLLVA